MSGVTRPPTTPEPPQDGELKNGADLGVPCPVCGAVTKVRTNHDNGSRFLGCIQYPACRGTAPIPTYHRMLAAGATRLPGF